MLAAKKHLDVAFAIYIYTFDETIDKLCGVHLHIAITSLQ